MSEIFLAYQRGIGGFRKIVALKTILPDTRGREDMVRMFLNEAKVSAEFNHPNIVQVYDLGIEKDTLFLTMEYVQGCSLIEMVRAYCVSQPTLPMGFVLAVVRDTALALSYAHSFVDMRHRKKPVIHRDVSGKNIMVTFDGTTKLLDFGIAKMQGTAALTCAGIVKGTTGYMSPEQLLGKNLDGRSDIFSLGIVLHECLTGYRLFHETTPSKTKMMVLNSEVPTPSSINPRIPSVLDAVVMKALELKPEKRFQTALELARALEEAAEETIWKAEQIGQLVSQHFSQRREETRIRIEEVRARLNELTGQIRLEDALIQNLSEGAQPSEFDAPLTEVKDEAATPQGGGSEFTQVADEKQLREEKTSPATQLDLLMLANASSLKHAASLSEQAAPSSEHTDSSLEQMAPPAEHVASASEQTAPPSKHAAPPAEHAASASEQTAPPSKHAAPPAEHVASASEQTAPPSKHVAPPSRRSALVPVFVPSAQETAAPLPSAQNKEDMPLKRLFSRFLDCGYFTLFFVSLLSGVVLAVLLFFTVFGPY